MEWLRLECPSIEYISLLLAVLAFLFSFPTPTAEEDDYVDGEYKYDATYCYSNNGWDRQFVASPPIGVRSRTVALQNNRHNR
jgi:hypothetical protein